MAPGGFIAAAHAHPNQEERFEIGGAELMFRVGGVQRLYRPGDVAVVPAGVPHTWWNPSQVEAATLIQLRPAPPLSRIVGPLSIVLAPVGRLLGYRARYERYSGPLPADGDATGASARS